MSRSLNSSIAAISLRRRQHRPGRRPRDEQVACCHSNRCPAIVHHQKRVRFLHCRARQHVGTGEAQGRSGQIANRTVHSGGLVIFDELGRLSFSLHTTSAVERLSISQPITRRESEIDDGEIGETPRDRTGMVLTHQIETGNFSGVAYRLLSPSGPWTIALFKEATVVVEWTITIEGRTSSATPAGKNFVSTKARSACSTEKLASRSMTAKRYSRRLQSAVVAQKAETFVSFVECCPDCHAFRPVKDTRRAASNRIWHGRGAQSSLDVVSGLLSGHDCCLRAAEGNLSRSSYARVDGADGAAGEAQCHIGRRRRCLPIFAY